jgi:hypothetical protein
MLRPRILDSVGTAATATAPAGRFDVIEACREEQIGGVLRNEPRRVV